MTHINVQIPNDLKRERKEYLTKISLLNKELEITKKEVEYLEDELENIPNAIKEYGYIEIPLNGKTIRLVPEKTI